MNNFTEKNTEEATHYHAGTNGRRSHVAHFIGSQGRVMTNHFTEWHGMQTIPDELVIKLSRPHNETREFHTVNGTTKYAQPQGNEMDIKKLVPIDFIRNITPCVHGDLLYNSRIGWEFPLTNDGLKDINSGQNNDHLFVVSFADRPSEGEQPVGDDVVVDVHLDEGSKYPTSAHAIDWRLGRDATHDVTSWKPNHAAMLKQWQASQEAKPMNDIDWIHGSEYYKPSTKEFFRMPESGSYAEYYSHHFQAWKVHASVPVSNLSRSYFIKRLEWPSCDSQENIGPGVKAKSSVQLRKLKAAHEKPTFTQAMADAGEDAPVGSRVMYLAGTGIKKEDGAFTKGYWDETTIVARHNDMTWLDTHGIQSDITIKPVQTAEEKLRDAIEMAIEPIDAIDGLDTPRVIDLLLASNKFTITLKG